MKKAKKIFTRERVSQYLMLTVGTCLTAMGTAVFFTPGKIVCGGVGGISTILNHLLNLPIGITYGVINAILLLIGIKILGKEFILKTIVGAALVSLFMELFDFLLIFVPNGTVTEDGMLASIFGGIVYGVGMGLTFIAKGSTGGTDVLGRLVQYKFQEVSIGKMIAIVDGIIILASLIVFRDLDLILFGIIGIFVQTLVIDAVMNYFNVAHMALIVTDKGEYVREYVRNRYDRGVTELKAQGYANEEGGKHLLLCVLNPKQSADLKEELEKVDEDSFVVFTDVKSVLGKGFKYYR